MHSSETPGNPNQRRKGSRTLQAEARGTNHKKTMTTSTYRGTKSTCQANLVGQWHPTTDGRAFHSLNHNNICSHHATPHQTGNGNGLSSSSTGLLYTGQWHSLHARNLHQLGMHLMQMSKLQLSHTEPLPTHQLVPNYGYLYLPTHQRSLTGQPLSKIQLTKQGGSRQRIHMVEQIKGALWSLHCWSHT